MNWRDVPVFLTNFNNLETGFRDMIDWFLKAEMKITVLDNKSSYPPLLEYYEQIKDKVTVVNVGYNANTWAFWQAGFNTEENTRLPYITSDGDCPPDADCPKDLVSRMLDVLDVIPTAMKVSPGIRVDNIPDWYARKQDAIGCQLSCARSPDWGVTQSEPLDLPGLPRLYRSITDTTLTLWRGGDRHEGRYSTNDWQLEQYRMDTPYLVKHVPWYQNSSSPTPEAQFYRNCPDKLVGPNFGI